MSVKRALMAFIDGAGSALDLNPPIYVRRPTSEAMAGYWVATGSYLWTGVEAHKATYELQRPLFDADALPTPQQ